MRDQRCRTPKAKVIAALQGDYRSEYLFVLAQCQQTHENLSTQIGEIDF